MDISPAAKVPAIKIEAGSGSISGSAGIQTNRNEPGKSGKVVNNAKPVNLPRGGSNALFTAHAEEGAKLP